MTILVTGGAGFIGANFVLDWMRETDERVVVLDKLSYAGNRDNLAALDGSDRLVFVCGDIADQALVEALLSEHRPRALLHFAAETHVDRSIHGPRDFIETNVLGTFVLLQAVRAYLDGAGADGEFRLLHVSTDEVYGSLQPQDPGFTEQHPYRPNSPYSASKAGSDHLVRAYHHTYGLPTLITNCSNNYGPFQFPEKLIPLVIHNALAGRDLPVYGDGMQIRDWLYVTDHCAAIRAVLARGTPGRVYNIGGDSERTNIEVVRTLCRLLDSERPRQDGRSYADQIAFVRDRPGHDRRYAIDAGRIKAELGWRPLESFESGLAKTVRWYLDNPRWVERVTSGAYRDWLDRSYS